MTGAGGGAITVAARRAEGSLSGLGQGRGVSSRAVTSAAERVIIVDLHGWRSHEGARPRR